MKWDDLAVLLAIVRGQSLAGAAERLSVDPSTVSRRLKAIEGALDAPLFVRTPDGLLPTELALRLAPHAELAEAAVRSAAAEIEDATRVVEGTVRIAASEGFACFVLARRLPELVERYPALNVELVASPRTADLRHREADLAIRFVRPSEGDLVARTVARSESYRAWGSADYAARVGSTAATELDWIGWLPELDTIVEANLFERVVGRRPRLASNSTLVMIEALRSGMGAMLLPDGLALREPGLVPLAGVPPIDFPVDVWLVTHRTLRSTPRVDAAWRWLVSLGEELDADLASAPGER